MAKITLRFNDSAEATFELYTSDPDEIDGFLELLSEGSGCVLPLLSGQLLALPPEPAGLRFVHVTEVESRDE